MSFRALTVPVAIAATFVVGWTLPPADAIAAVKRDCGHMPNRLAFNIKTRNVFCGKARRIVRRWGKTAAQQRGGDGWVLGLYCNYRNTGYEAGAIHCAHRGRVVRWETAS